MNLRIGFVFIAFLAVAVWAQAQVDPVEVAVESGRSVGMREGVVDVYRGIPYAEPPLGELRWRPPVPAKPWREKRNALTYGATAPQSRSEDNTSVLGDRQSEDCLTLNVWAPHQAQHLPVMVWIHGGGMMFGSGNNSDVVGSHFAEDGVILVTINYRLGLLGFFAHPALTEEAASDAPLYAYGTMDQILAIKWVRKNISAFGGDPNNITVFGGSAGGSSVLALMSTSAGEGLFAKAIVQSGSAWQPTISLAQEEKKGSAIASRLGLPGAKATAGQLRAANVEDLVKLLKPHDGVEMVNDGRLFHQTPTRALALHQLAAIPLLIGSNSDEGSALSNNADIPAMMTRVPASIRALYQGSDDTVARALFTDSIGTEARWVAEQASPQAAVFLYHFSYVPNYRRDKASGARHGEERPFVFGTYSRFPYATAQDIEIEQQVHRYWVTFAKFGRPTEHEQQWPRYSTKEDQLLDIGAGTVVRNHFQKDKYDAIEAISLPQVLP